VGVSWPWQKEGGKQVEAWRVMINKGTKQPAGAESFGSVTTFKQHALR
jgi:hypothetical protein